MKKLYYIFISLLLATSVFASNTFTQKTLNKLLPPQPKWTHQDSFFIKRGKWITPVEKTNFQYTATYAQVTRYIHRMQKASKYVAVRSLINIPGGYKEWAVVISTSRNKSPKGLQRSGKPTVFFEASIHPGESVGTDAGLILMRQLTQTKKGIALLKKVNVVFVPIVNIQGHENTNGNHARSNQRGPVNGGWRTNGRNINLNRDFSKLDSNGIQGIIKGLNQYKPLLYLDIHTTDGMSYAYDTTWCNNGVSGYSPNETKWLNKIFTPIMTKYLTAKGHIPHECIDANDTQNPKAGYYPYYSDGPRYSNAYTDARHIPSFLVELHSLKPYKQRVSGAYDFMYEALVIITNHKKALLKVTKQDINSRPNTVPLDWKEGDTKPHSVPFKVANYKMEKDNITGVKNIVWLKGFTAVMAPVTPTPVPAYTAKRPKYYYIPAAWQSVITRLKIHGIHMKTLTKSKTVTVRMYKANSYKVTKPIYEGHTRVEGTFKMITKKVTYLPGSVRISTNQPLGTLAVALLEPHGIDSFFQWGFFNTIFHNAEEMETYIEVPLGKRLLETNPEVKAEFEQKLQQDSAFQNNPEARLQWIYEHLPYYDQNENVYPVGIVY